MTGAHGAHALQIIGKDIASPGILTVEQMPAALQALQAAINQEKSGSSAKDGAGDDAAKEAQYETSVTLHQRLWPLMDLIKSSLDARVNIVWGV